MNGEIETEIDQLGNLKHIGFALIQFCRALPSTKPGTFVKKSNAWIYVRNFIGFEIRYKRIKQLNILVRPVKAPPEVQKILPLYKGPLSYSRAEITTARQLAAACFYIESSWRDWYLEIFHKDPIE